MTILDQLAQSLQQGQVDTILDLVDRARKQGIEAQTILRQGLISGMDIIGEKFQAGEMFIPHMLLAARAMNAGIDVLKPELAKSGAKPSGHVILGTVKGDHHDIGKNLVRIMLEGKGFSVTDLGINVEPEAFAEAVTEEVQIVAMSALLSTTAPFIGETIETLEKHGLRKQVKTIIGGGVVTQQMANDIGADAYGQDAAIGAVKALELVDSLSA